MTAEVSTSRDLQDWLVRQYDVSVGKLFSAISATHLVKERRGFGQTIRPLPGSVVASTALGSWDPDPDYFFHWLRDSAIVIDALRHVIAEGGRAKEGVLRLKEFVAFSLFLNRLDGESFLSACGDFRQHVEPSFLQFVRDDADLRAIAGERIFGEPRFNPDATLDISKWSRPQHDGPALRALALMRFWPLNTLDDELRASMRALISADLQFVLTHWREPCFDLWEEEKGEHYYTRLIHHAALADGAAFARQTGDDSGYAGALDEASREIARSLDEYWRVNEGFYRSRRNVVDPADGKELDFATILAVLHGRRKFAHGVLDPRVMATLARLEELFESSYQINKNRPPHLAPALGRYAGDRYFSGGAYYFSTLGAAEYYYRLAAAVRGGADLPSVTENGAFLQRLGLGQTSSAQQRQRQFEILLNRGDQFMATVATYTPSSGELSEQFDQNTGAQTSAKSLAWSHAALISAAARRKAACPGDAAATQFAFSDDR